MYEYPKADDITDEQKQYIQNYIRDFENSLFNIDNTASDRDYNNYIDIDSFVDYFILNELTGNIDAYRLSTYMHKNRGGKLKMGPIWDLNIGYNRQDRVPLPTGLPIITNMFQETPGWFHFGGSIFGR